MWKSRQNITDNLKNRDEKVKVSSLCTQLQYHSIILSSSAPDNYYFQKPKTEKGRKIDFDSTTMVKHLPEIIDLNVAKFREADPDDILLSQIVAELNLLSTKQPFNIVSSEKITEVLEKQKEKLKNTLQEARTKRQSNRCKEMLETFTRSPYLLVGKRIKHKAQESKEAIPEWNDGTVRKIDYLDKEQGTKTLYDIVYDIDGEDHPYSFPLLNDLKRGNLIIMN